MLNKLVNLFRKNKDKIDYSKYGMGCIPSPISDSDQIYEVKCDIKCAYYKDRYEKDEEYRRRINKEFMQEN